MLQRSSACIWTGRVNELHGAEKEKWLGPTLPAILTSSIMFFEEGGSEEIVGRPRAFIEVAWRRYTKHSRNKCQEIQAAVAPLAEHYKDEAPFRGAILAGVFTENARKQLESNGFGVAYCPYETIVKDFGEEGVDITSEENTVDAELEAKARVFQGLGARRLRKIHENIRQLHEEELNAFMERLRLSLGRRILRVSIIPVSGQPCRFHSIEEAVDFIRDYDQTVPISRFLRYEVTVRYSNGDEVRGEFNAKGRAVEFLRSL